MGGFAGVSGALKDQWILLTAACGQVGGELLGLPAPLGTVTAPDGSR
jgi:hypothetical protein